MRAIAAAESRQTYGNVTYSSKGAAERSEAEEPVFGNEGANSRLLFLAHAGIPYLLPFW